MNRAFLIEVQSRWDNEMAKSVFYLKAPIKTNTKIVMHYNTVSEL